MISILQAMMSNTGSRWNAADKSAAITLSNDGLTAAGSVTKAGVRGDLAHASGKYYFEVDSADMIGIASTSWSFANIMGQQDSNSAGYLLFGGGTIYARSGADTITSASGSAGIRGVAVDVSNNLVYFSNGGTWQSGGNPAAGTGGINYGTAAPMFPAFQAINSSGPATLNVGNTPFTYPVPTGFAAWG